jgi:hypothetical protein
MIRTLITASLLFAAPVLAEDNEEHSAQILVEVTLSSGGKIMERAALHTDLKDHGSSFQGTLTMKSPEGGRWLIQINGFLGNEKTKEEDRELYVGVSDLLQLDEHQREGTRSVLPVQIVSAARIWRGPGNYRLAEHGDLVLSAKVADTRAQQPMLPTPEATPAKE